MGDKLWAAFIIIVIFIILAVMFGVLNFHFDASGAGVTVNGSNMPPVNVPKINIG